MFEDTGSYPDILWTWNPRYYASILKTKIVYEAYPRSQDEVDDMASKLSIDSNVITIRKRHPIQRLTRQARFIWRENNRFVLFLRSTVTEMISPDESWEQDYL